MKQLNFDLVILGNEPAGLWLAEQYIQLCSGASVAWIPLHPQSLSIPLLSSLAKRFSIADSSPPDFFEFISTSGTHSTDPRHFQANPRKDILLQSLWKSLSRTQSITPEILSTDKFLPLSYSYWEPSRSLPRQITHFQVPEGGQFLENIEIHSGKSLSLVLKHLGSVRSSKWIINCNLQDWRELTGNLPQDKQLFNPEANLFNASWTVPIEATVEEKFLNQALKPFSILLESEHLPHPLYETWVLEAGKVKDAKRTLRLWVDLPPGQSPSELSKWSEKGLAALRRAFPFLREQSFELKEKIIPLPLERYRSSLLSPYTRYPFLFCLSPYVNCHFPYPEGTLESAQKLLQNWLGSAKQTKLA